MKVEILENSFALIRPNAVEFAHSFYENLFQAYPETRSLFSKVSIVDQEKKLLISLIAVIENLRNITYLKTMLNNLGQRHLNYNVINEHYQMVGISLLKTLESYLKNNWTPEVKQAWTEAYELIVEVMLAGAKEQNVIWSSEIGIKKSISRLRIEAIAQKTWKETESIDSVIEKLIQDPYFQKLQENLGTNKTMILLTNFVSSLFRS